MEYLKITRDGLKLFKHNQDRQAAHRCKQRDGKFLVLNKAKEVVASFETEAEQDRFFYDETPIASVFQHLRSEVGIEPGVTLIDVIHAISGEEDLEDLALALFPFYPHILGANSGDEPAQALILQQSGEIKDNWFSLETNFGFVNNRNWRDETLLEIETDFIIRKDGEEYGRGIRTFSLLELMEALFSTGEEEPCAFTKEGLFDSQGAPGDPIGLLLHPVAIADDVTLGDVFNFVSKDDFLTGFFALYSWCRHIEEFHADALKPNDDKDGEKLWFLEVYRYIDLYDPPSHLDFEPNFHAVGELTEQEKEHYDSHPEQKRPDYTQYGIGMSPMNHIAHLNIKLDTVLEIWKRHKNEVTKEVFKTSFTLLDFLDAIYWEISFYGGPQSSEELREELAGRVKEVEAALESGDMSKFIPLEDVLKGLEDDE